MRPSARHLFVVALTIAGGTLVFAYSSSAATQPARVESASGDDLRAMFATSGDVAEGQRLADTACSSCHGMDGISTLRNVPHLAGQRAAYLHHELRSYQSGTRRDDGMKRAVEFLSDDALVKVAAYYASLDPAQPAAGSAAKSSSANQDTVQAGKRAAASCGGCHGESGVTRTPGTPSLAGLDPKYLVRAMKAFRAGEYKSDVMAPMLAQVTDVQMENLALFYAMQKTARAPTPATGDRALGKAAAAACASCHGDLGVSADPVIPSLAGQDAQYVAAALKAFKDGSRSDATMRSIATSLDERASRNIAAFYAAQQPGQSVRRSVPVADWIQKCDRCHGVDGNSTDPRSPALAAQRVEYLQKALRTYQTGARNSVAMAAMSGMLTDADVESLAAHYARQKPRAVIYVTLPPR